MLRLKFTIRMLLVASAAIAIYFPVRDAYEPWRRDRLRSSNHTYLDCENLCAITEGDSVELVTRHFPSLIEVEPTATLLSNLRLPEFGTKDRLYRYSYPHENGYNFFHFHDGCLVNHPKTYYSDPVAMVLARGGRAPTIFERMSTFPLYLATLVAVYVIYCLCRNLVKIFRPKVITANTKHNNCTIVE